MHILVLCTEAVVINTVFTFASAKLYCFEIKLFLSVETFILVIGVQ